MENKLQKKNETKKVNIHKNHRKRLRAEIRNVNYNTLEDYKLVELILTYCFAQKDVNPLAHELMNIYGNIANLLEASHEELMKINGIGESCSTLIRLFVPLFERYKKQKADFKCKLTTTKDYFNYFGEQFKYDSSESCIVIVLDNNFSVEKYLKVSTGMLDRVSIDCSTIFDIIKPTGCNKVILMHNHPSGNPKPSPEDFAATRKLFFQLDSLNVAMIDHIIVSANGYYSFKDENFIEQFKVEAKQRLI